MMHALPEHQDLHVAVAGHGLPGAILHVPDEPLDDTSWEALLRNVRRQRLSGHLATAIAAGAFPATAEQTEVAANLHAEAMALSVLLERVLLSGARLLDRAGVDYRVLKGPALAHTVYPSPALREFGDIDLLVPGEQMDAAQAAFAEAGWRRPWPQLRPGFDRRFGKGSMLVGSDGLEVDLHRTFVQGPFGLTVDLAALFEGSAAIRVGGHDIPVLEPAESFLVACYHAALGSVTPRLVPLRDVAQFLLSNDVDEARVLALARRWGGEAVVARAISLTWETLHLADAIPLSQWALRYQPTRAEERALASYLRPDRSYAAKALASLRVIKGPSAKAAFVRALLLPDRDALASYGEGHRSWWGRGGRALLQRGGAP